VNNLTLSSLLETELDNFQAQHRLPLYQLKALTSYRNCRTSKMGSHSQYCEKGHLMGVWYDSCKRRGCPQCLAYSTEVWLTRQQERLLAETHHHWVFTIPHELLDIWRFNRRLMQDLLFSAVADTLKLLSKDKKYLVAQPAFVLSLHT
jgi:hypothetical protein